MLQANFVIWTYGEESMKVVAVTTVTGPYIIARYRCFAEMYPQHELTLLELGRESRDYAWTPSSVDVPYQRKILSDKPIEEYSSRNRPSLICSALEELHPELLVVCGYGVTGMIAALRWAIHADRMVAVVTLSDSTEDDRMRSWWKEKLKQQIIKQSGASLVAGLRHRDYMLSLGMPENKVFTGYDVVDNDFFWHGAQEVRKADSYWRDKLDLPKQFFLTSARFLRSDSGVDRPKNLHRLIEAYACYLLRCDESAWSLVILGDGELRTELEDQVASLGIVGNVTFIGFKQYLELPCYFGLADAFVLSSVKDTWGLVVNEAMASGLPVLVSERCGCAPDLVINGRNGFTFDPYNVDELANQMLRISAADCDRDAMGRASLEIISRWSPETFARGLSTAIDAAVSSKVSSTTWWERVMLQVLSYR